MVPNRLRTLSADDWLLEAVRYFRVLGFFDEQAGLTDTQIGQLAVTKAGREPNPMDEWADLSLVTLNENRLWCEDMEDVAEAEGYYAEMVVELAKLSRGVFDPVDIKETFAEPDMVAAVPTIVTFQFGGKSWQLTTNPGEYGVWLDPTVFGQLNVSLANTGYGFYQLNIPDQCAYVVFLSHDQASALRNDRGWVFDGDPMTREERIEWYDRQGLPGEIMVGE